MNNIINKEEAIRKINKGGKIGHIVSKVLSILIIIAFVGCVIGTIVVACLPKNLFTVETSSKVTVTTNLAVATERFAKNDPAKVLEDAKISINNQQFETQNMVIDGDNLIVDTEAENITITTREVLLPLIVANLALVFTFITVFFVNKFCKSLETAESPFSDDVIKHMRMVAYSLIPWTVFSMISESTMSSFIGSNNISINIDFNTVFVILIVLGLSYIFRYGAALQVESDETI